MIHTFLRSQIGEKLMLGLAGLCAFFGVAIVFSVLGVSAYRGSEILSFSFLVSKTAETGLSGGILYQLIGSFILLCSATFFVIPCACAISILDLKLRQNNRKIGIRAILHVINSTPSIIFGILGFIFFIKIIGWSKSWLAGGVILALMILPTVTLSLISRLESIPSNYVETAKSLGLTSDQLLKSIYMPYSCGGLLTGLVMGLSRAAGETAPIMFAAVVFSGASIPGGIVDDPVLALPYHIFTLAQDVLAAEAIQSAWATSFILILFVFILSSIAAPIRSRSHEEAN